MKKSFLAPVVFLTIAAISLTGAPAAVADDTEPVPTPANVVVTTPGILTLPNGDGVRDTTVFTLEADAPTTVALSLVDPADESVVSVLEPVTLTEGALTATVPLTLEGVVRPGGFALRTTPEGGETTSTKVMIGSGQPQFANISLSREVIYTYKKATARSSVATVSARDETGERVPFIGSVVAKVGSKSVTSKVSSTAGADAKVTIAASSLPLGAGTVTFAATGQGLTSKGSAKLVVRSVAVSATKVSASQRTLYPARDGYLDSTKITVSTSATTGSTIAATGTVKIVRGNKTVRTWRLSSTKHWSTTWDGKIGGKIVPGKYSVAVAVKGPQGAAKTAKTIVTVKSGKLVTKTSKTTYRASSVFTKWYDRGDSGENACFRDVISAGDVFCEGWDGVDGVAILGEGFLNVPAAVVGGQKFGGTKVRITANVSHLYGDAAWGYWRAGTDIGKSAPITSKGATRLGWLGLPSATRKLDLAYAVAEYSDLGIKNLTVEYSYKVMSR